jgi:uncharacterized protein (TIGR03083 family)
MMALEPIRTAPLFAPLHAELVTLLRGLDRADWERPTLAGDWKVRDVAAHLLDGDLRTLSARRDAHLPAPDREIEDAEQLPRSWTRSMPAG